MCYFIIYYYWRTKNLFLNKNSLYLLKILKNMDNNHKTAVMTSIIIVFILGFYLSFTFFKSTSKPKVLKKISSCQEMLIDSVKAVAVRDTALFFTHQIQILGHDLVEKETLITAQRKLIQQLKKDKDSLNTRLQISRQGYRNLLLKQN